MLWRNLRRPESSDGLETKNSPGISTHQRPVHATFDAQKEHALLMPQ